MTSETPTSALTPAEMKLLLENIQGHVNTLSSHARSAACQTSDDQASAALFIVHNLAQHLESLCDLALGGDIRAGMLYRLAPHDPQPA